MSFFLFFVCAKYIYIKISTHLKITTYDQCICILHFKIIHFIRTERSNTNSIHSNWIWLHQTHVQLDTINVADYDLVVIVTNKERKKKTFHNNVNRQYIIINSNNDCYTMNNYAFCNQIQLWKGSIKYQAKKKKSKSKISINFQSFSSRHSRDSCRKCRL